MARRLSRRTRRWQTPVLVMLVWSSIINYFDGSSLAIANVSARHDLGLDATGLLSAFALSYAFAQLPVGFPGQRACRSSPGRQSTAPVPFTLALVIAAAISVLGAVAYITIVKRPIMRGRIADKRIESFTRSAEFSAPNMEALMQPASQSRPVVKITGLIYALIGLALAAGGMWLAALGGSLYYLIAGLGILVTGALLIAGRRSALWVYAAVLIGTLIWAVSEVGFDWWPLAARGDVVFPLALSAR